MIYKLIGKAVVKIAVLYLGRRYGRHLRIAAALAVVFGGIAAYAAASRDVEEG